MKFIVIKALLMTVSAFFIVAAPFLYFPGNELVAASSKNITENNVILLDAGHGGEDGGAIGIGGIIEKDINLSITLKTSEFLEFFGYDIEYTRKTDKMTCDEGLKTQREKKVSDIKNRLWQIENSHCLCSISIHQNIFGGNVTGAQVFYSKNNPESKLLAESLQSGISSMLQPENKRVIKESTKDIYILYHTEKPAVLVECGFISNEKEAALLSDENYQNKMAFAIASSTVKHLTEREV
ncbi:MAG: N-acetylmuramoyl-L-alanine amidase [Oscillospiraceae bacterium]|nr:N-acetylmuramoyl-L-alanine amidase [Oscillospiraceae bacterium]